MPAHRSRPPPKICSTTLDKGPQAPHSYSMASHAGTLPPHLPLLFNPNPESVLADAKSAIAKTEEVWDKVIANVDPSQASIENTILPVAYHENEQMAVYDLVYLYATTHPSRDIREAAREGKRLADEAEIDRYNREDMFARVDAVLGHTEESSVDPETYRYLVKHHAQFLENGCGLPEDSRVEFKKKLKHLSSLTRQFAANLDDDTSGMWFDSNALDGLPAPFLAKLKKGTSENEGKYWVSMKRSDHESMMKFCSSGETRMRYFIEHQNRMPVNISLTREIILLRDALARQRGYGSWALMRMANKMITHPSAVLDMLEKIRPELEKLAKKEAGELLELKKAHEDASDRLFLWDRNFYLNQQQQEQRRFDSKLTMEYFELYTVVKNTLSIYENLFGIRFELVDQDRARELRGEEANQITWQEDVLPFLVWDLKADEESFLGWIYFDLVSILIYYSKNLAYDSKTSRKTKREDTKKRKTGALANLRLKYSREGKHSHHAAHFALRKVSALHF